jgi:hypothetical protein
VLDARMDVHVADRGPPRLAAAPKKVRSLSPRSDLAAAAYVIWRAALDLRGHLGQQHLQAVEVRDRLAELLPLPGMADRPGARRERAPYRAMNRISSRV